MIPRVWRLILLVWVVPLAAGLAAKAGFASKSKSKGSGKSKPAAGGFGGGGKKGGKNVVAPKPVDAALLLRSSEVGLSCSVCVSIHAEMRRESRPSQPVRSRFVTTSKRFGWLRSIRKRTMLWRRSTSTMTTRRCATSS